MTTNSNMGKFSERLSKMRRDRIRIKKYGKMDQLEEETIKKNKRKAVLVKSALIPVMVAANAFTFEDINEEKKEEENLVFLGGNINNDHKVNKIPVMNNQLNTKKINKRIIVDEDNDEVLDLEISISNQKGINQVLKQYPKVEGITNEQEKTKDDIVTNQKKVIDIGKEEERQKLEKAILDLFKKRFIKNINDFEMLKSDLYVLSEIDSNDIEYEKCKKNIEEVRRILNKIRDLREEYDFLKENFDFEYLLELKDNSLIDKIIELKEMCSKQQLDDMIEEYKLLEEYQYLYTKIEELENEAIEFEDYKDDKVEELKERDIKFEDFKDNVVNLDRIKESYENFVDEQNAILKSLEEKLADIDSYERVEVRLKGFGELIENTFRYMALLVTSPLCGLIPSIATEMIITKNTIKNLRQNLKWEESKKMVYTAIDYDSSIRYALANVEEVSILVNNTFDDIVKLKKEFTDKFEKYCSEIPEYEDTIKKLNKIENAIVGNKMKLNTTVDKLKRDKMINENKLKRVKKLNESQKEIVTSE